MAQQGYTMVRYADDFVVLCPTVEAAAKALEEIKAWVEANGLTLHPDKTHVGDCRIEGQGFEFLGYRFEAGQRWVRKKSLMALKDKVRMLTRRTRGDSLGRIIADLNPMLRGWYGYFKHAQGRVFQTLDALIRRRLRALLRKQEKRPGFGRNHADHRRWPNAFFAINQCLPKNRSSSSAKNQLYRAFRRIIDYVGRRRQKAAAFYALLHAGIKEDDPRVYWGNGFELQPGGAQGISGWESICSVRVG
jgi:hypothetical protein